jgi:hypothetical protein
VISLKRAAFTAHLGILKDGLKKDNWVCLLQKFFGGEKG